ncbi:hypothetical protein QBC99_005295 [Beijerinckia sp. GAS462]|nr:hypothetical protein [Beijerinckia sp. GAS462]
MKDDAAADNHDQKYDYADGQPPAYIAGAEDVYLDMEQDIGAEQKTHGYQHHEIAPVAPGDDFDRGGRGDGSQEQAVDRHGEHPVERARKEHSDSPGKPQQHQGEKR